MSRTLSTADVRREDLLVAASTQFARRGYYGTPTTEIARDAGISQAYLFRLFPTKLELFVAVVDRCMEQVDDAFRAAAAPHRGDLDAALDAMGEAYSEMLNDRDRLLLQLQGYSGADDPQIRDAVQRGYGRIVDTVRELTGADDERVAGFFATGLLLTVMAAIGAHDLDRPWAQSLMNGIKNPC
jgi:AcrR family transcriptional regulator